MSIFSFRSELTTGGGGVQIEIFQASNAFFPFRAELTTGGGGGVEVFRQKKFCMDSWTPHTPFHALHMLHFMDSHAPFHVDSTYSIIFHFMNSTYRYSFLWTPQISLLTQFYMSKTQIQHKLPFIDSTKVLVSTLKIRPEVC